MVARAVIHALRRRGAISDAQFDRLFPVAHRERSEVHWTPVEVARHAAAMLDGAPGGEVLDVGAGVGKVCLIGALTTDLRWTGVERNPAMVRVAKRIAIALGVERTTTFVTGDAGELDWRRFGGVYLYNPFAESVFTGAEDADARRIAYHVEVAHIERKLATLRRGAGVVTFHGFGGEMPPGFELVEATPMYKDVLLRWVRR
jgi:SAM-dependent methyltransferase